MKNLTKKTLAKTALAGSVFLASGSAFAATADGSLGATSTGTVDITATVANLIQVSGLSEIAFGTLGAGPYTQDEPLCVYRNGAGAYRVTATSGGGFLLNETTPGSPATNIGYTVGWSGTATAGAGAALTSGTQLATNFTGHTSEADCGGSDNANIRITLTDADVEAANPGSYTDELTILVDPV